jgi:hypothetical protein
VATLIDTEGRLTYFGLPIVGNAVAIIVDSDPAITPYREHLSMATRIVRDASTGANRNLGIIQSTGQRRMSLAEVAHRDNRTLEGAEIALSPKPPPEGLDFRAALTIALNGYADQVLLVLARPLDSNQIEALAQSAEQTGVTTGIIAMGPAAKQDLSALSDATDGNLVSLSQDRFNEWVEQYRQSTASN